jgi:predicted RNA-binding Zn-ribbon protein involved in translation (DUF1610 family)
VICIAGMGPGKGGLMRCYVCDQLAELADSPRDADFVDCPRCGSYGITRSALAEVHANVYVFNKARTDDWFKAQREAGEARPIINTQSGLYE